MRRLKMFAGLAAAVGLAVGGYLLTGTSARAANFSAVPPTSGSGAGLCYWNDSLQPYAIDGGQDAIAPRTDLTGAWYGMLEPVTSSSSTAEQFDICYSLQGDYWYLVNNGNGLFVSAEVEYPGAYNGILRARSEEVGPWEKYQVACHDGLITIKSMANGKYVSTEIGYPGNFNGVLRARASTVGPWEMYRDTDQMCNPAYSNPL